MKDIAVFICGPRVHRREIEKVPYVRTPSNFSEQGKKDVSTPHCWAVYLGKEVYGPQPNARSFVFRIRKRYFDDIVKGLKTVEYRKDSEFWRVRFAELGGEG